MIALVALVFIGTFAYLFKRSQPKETVYQELTPTRGDVVKTTVYIKNMGDFAAVPPNSFGET